VIGALKRAVRDRTRPAEWEYVPEGWARADAPAADPLRGWDVDSVAEAYRTRVPEFQRLVTGTEPLAIPTSASVAGTPPNVNDQNTILVFGLALTRAWARRGQDRISVLDYGGGFGFASFLARALLPDTVAIDYHVEEVATVCEVARRTVPTVTFTSDATAEARRYDLVMASNSLQYARDWRAVVGRLAAAADQVLLLLSVPMVRAVPAFVALQRTQQYRFDTEYLSWVFNRDELVGAVADPDRGLVLDREFLQSARPQIPRAPEPPHTGAFLFERRA
jgi:putative methyltransferase (TIGR04325 family)